MTVLARLGLPVVGAPMAGGVSGPMLVSAVSDAGGLGMLAAGYRTPEQLAADLVHVRDLTDRPFGVNLFVPRPLDRAALEPAVTAYREALLPRAAALGVEPGHPVWHDTDAWAEKVLLVETLAPTVVSCTFGVPDAEAVERWRAAGCEVHVTVTSVAEALAAEAGGADVLVLQGQEAGGHRGTHDPAAEPEAIDHLGLLEAVRGAGVGLPLVAAGGITTPGDVRRASEAGAVAVQVGTALLLAPESGASPTYRAGLRDPSLTERVLTRAFTGRVAGAVRNRWVDELADLAPRAFPVVDQVSRPLRAAAARAGDLHGLHLWAGAGWRACQERPAAEIVRDLVGG
ncbi:nitronate monooxygenase [Ornithinimicrobium humiphilum]|uniref:Propionate 3-nitronate monooxygenase n=1 Tax=Ornithinimicrobium humiphilum TaxID=125288 RepID=A0A543KPW8_9MICO|nr:nitronate monooxygenase [Ornithinimicrobium humiphilum]TQM97123.1 nitroalkane oxidase [Ornithinimicrobium humiphilum]